MDEKSLVIIGVACLFAFLVCNLIISTKRKKIVETTSDLLRKLDKINESSSFHKDIKKEYTQSRKMLTKPKYDHYDCSQFCDEILLDELHPLQETLKKIKENRAKYCEYSQKVERLKSKITPEEVEKFNIPYEKYCEIEKSLFTGKRLKPILDGEITCIIEYTSPAGRNHYSKKHTYSYVYAIQRLDELQEMLKRKESQEFKRKMERSKMSLKLRMAVLERDGRRCQICGARQEDGATLHVDHIIPVARGGKTEMGNLRTLCDMCNQGKRDQILENDIILPTDKE